jgi:DNA-binding transcriptional LysR family regulator
MDLALALRAFVRTVERGSITAASRDIGVSQPAVTKHLRNLERHVGARLLERSSRVVRPTALGRTLYEASSGALATIDSALEGVRRDMGVIEGPLRIHAPSCVGAKHFHRIAMDFQAKHPDVVIDLVLENRNVDIIYENFDLALRYGRPEGQELIIRRLGLVRRFLVASPDYLARFGAINTLAELSGASIVTTHAVTSSGDTLTLQGNGKSHEVAVRPILRTDNAQVIVDALLSGQMVGPIQQLLVSKELAEGQLIRILPDYEIRPTEVFIAYPSVRFMRPVVRAFTDFMLPRLAAIEGVDFTHRSPASDRMRRDEGFAEENVRAPRLATASGR